MEKLSKDWLTQGLIDFEYKKYVLMAYLHTVKNSFERTELYPFMADLVFHYRNLLAIKENKTLIQESFPKEISLEEFEKMFNDYFWQPLIDQVVFRMLDETERFL